MSTQAIAPPVVKPTGMYFARADVAAACHLYGERVQYLPAGVDACQLMWAIANNESIHHASHPELLYCDPRF